MIHTCYYCHLSGPEDPNFPGQSMQCDDCAKEYGLQKVSTIYKGEQAHRAMLWFVTEDYTAQEHPNQTPRGNSWITTQTGRCFWALVLFHQRTTSVNEQIAASTVPEHIMNMTGEIHPSQVKNLVSIILMCE